MKKKLGIGIAMLIVSSTTFAGGLLTNTNQHIAFLRNPARDASIEIDAVYSNPAGLAFLYRDGFHISINGQSAYQTRTICSGFRPFLMNADGHTDKDGYRTFEGKASAPLVPSIHAAYKRNKWVFSGNFAVTGGGGKATFNDGLGSFESQVAMVPVLLQQAGSSLGMSNLQRASAYSVDSYMQGRQYIFGLQLGATYKFTDFLSAYVGARINYVSNGYTGHIRNIQSNIGPDGEMVNLNKYFTQMSEQAMQAASAYQAAGDAASYQKYMKLAGAANSVAEQTADKNLECSQTGWGVTPILGVDFKWKKLNVGVKYEFNTSLNVQNNTKVDDTGLFKHGVNTPHDIPSLLTVGVSYEIFPMLRASVGYHHFFDTHAKMANNKQDFISRGTNEYLGGLEWDICRWAQVSAGMQRTKYSLGDGYMSDMSFTTSSYSFGFGAGFRLAKDLKLNIAYFWTNYETQDKNVSNFMNTGLSYSDSFTRTNKVFGVGLDYCF